MSRATLDHFEIPVADSDRLVEFLESVFGWVAEEVKQQSSEESGDQSRRTLGTRYRRLAATDVGSASTQPVVRVGLFEGPPEVLDRAVPVVSLEGETLEVCLDRVASAGGQVVLDPKAVGDSGRFARFEDPEGNQWGIWEPSLV